MEKDKVISFVCKNCGLTWEREFSGDAVEDIERINLSMVNCPACIYGN